VDTHSSDIDAALVPLMTGHGWECLRRYDMRSVNETPYGTIRFQDGIQGWVNRRFVR
jgi:hypothetical protein